MLSSMYNFVTTLPYMLPYYVQSFLPFTGDIEKQLTGATAPVISLLQTIFRVAIPVVGAVGLVYCIALGIKYAKADEQQDREKAKHALKNAIIGFVLIFVLAVALTLSLPIFNNWATEAMKGTK